MLNLLPERFKRKSIHTCCFSIHSLLFTAIGQPTRNSFLHITCKITKKEKYIITRAGFRQISADRKGRSKLSALVDTGCRSMTSHCSLQSLYCDRKLLPYIQ